MRRTAPIGESHRRCTTALTAKIAQQPNDLLSVAAGRLGWSASRTCLYCVSRVCTVGAKELISVGKIQAFWGKISTSISFRFGIMCFAPGFYRVGRDND